MLNAELRIETPDAGMISAALRPEAGRKLPRTRVTVEDSEGLLTVRIEADDTSAMRAALNSYLGCIKITEDINRITGD